MSEEVCSFPNQDTVRLREGLHRFPACCLYSFIKE